MDVYITDKASGARLRLPLNPDKLSTTGSASTVTHSPISVGEVKTPRGNKLNNYQWDGMLPGAAMKNASWVRDWQDPNKILGDLEQYKNKGTRLTLMVTGTNINVDVFIDRLNADYAGGAGNVEYSISMTEWRTITVKTVPEAGVDPPKEPDPAPPTKTVVYYKVRITTKNAGGYSRIYKSKSTSSSVLKKLKNGTEVEYIDGKSNKSWAKCKHGNVTGWMWKANITYSRTVTT